MAILSPEDIVNHDGDVEAAIAAKRVGAREHYAETGSYPEEWEAYSKIFDGRGRPAKYKTADEYFIKGQEYFQYRVKEGRNLTVTGLALWMGFPSPTAMRQHAIAHHEVRDYRAFFLSVIRDAVEETVTDPGGQPGKQFVLKNIPDALLSTDDVSYREVSIWADKQVTELTGLNGGPVKIDREMKPEEAYMMMLEGGTLAEAKDKIAEQATDELEDAMKEMKVLEENPLDKGEAS